MKIEEVRADIAAFADDDEDVIVDRAGQILFRRGGVDQTAELIEDANGMTYVQLDSTRLAYREFLGRHLAQLDLLAQRLLNRRQADSPFVDGPAELQAGLTVQPQLDTGRNLLDQACRTAPAFAARVLFVTADAGQGKTALLKQYQIDQAQRYLKRDDAFLFWHIDLQGRQLLRLSEALMGDLGDMRVSGIFMPSILRLLRHRLLVLAVDGFDELAAEQGSGDALGALAGLLQELDDTGTLVAASRRTFFDTDDYVKRSGMLQRHEGATDAEFHELRLQAWPKETAVAFLGAVRQGRASFPEPAQTYESLKAALGNDDDHPMLSTPFLLSHLANAMLMYGQSPSQVIGTMQDPRRGVASVVEAFISREVSDKWKFRETGEPYLTEVQHMRLLADVAEEMYRSGKDRLTVDIVETIAGLLLDDWNVAADRQQAIMNMVRMHVLLVPPPNGSPRDRMFDHTEFRDFFLGLALTQHLQEAANSRSYVALGQFLSVSQITDATSRYGSTHIDSTTKQELLTQLEELVQREWRPSYLQINVGTLVPYLLDDLPSAASFSARVVYSSLVFERTRFRDVEIKEGEFLRISFNDVDWQNVEFIECHFTELSLHRRVDYSTTSFHRCTIDALVLFGENMDDEVRAYAPRRIAALLSELDIGLDTDAAIERPEEVHGGARGALAGVIDRLLLTYLRTTVLTELDLERKFKQDKAVVVETIIPLMERHGIVAARKWKGAGTPRGSWILERSVEAVSRAEHQDMNDGGLEAFWDDVRKLDGAI